MNTLSKPGFRAGILTAALACAALTGCDKVVPDYNAAPVYGSTGLPANCRAYVQVVIDGYRSKQYNASDSMSALERNCGMVGWLWEHRT